MLSRQLDDASGFAEIFARWNGQFHQMSRGKFEGSIDVVTGQRVRLFQAKTNQAILTRGMDSQFATFIPITPRNAATRWSGCNLNPGDLIAKFPEAEYNNQTIPDTSIRALLVPVCTLQEMTCILAGGSSETNFPSWSALRPEPKAMERFERGLAELLTTSLRSPKIVGGAEGKSLEMECLRRLIDALLHPSVTEPARMREKNRRLLVRRALDVMHDRLNEPLTAIELCAELGASDRSLRRAFREAFGLGPLAYFRVIRLHQVRVTLKGARGSDVSVAEIARRWGFHRLGSFSNEYRRQFGELPSRTLKVRGRPSVNQGASVL
ncbi:helix-turn-helix domain-containing protein [Bythopirellula polymerisocia]|uniref:helix-turn-helix domain-containing protein n=1 Tax=Bythopirellula polymerisocia TaxID=2528003 RepID=UPI0028F4316B|nr:helix-turn-helix domain-containing protein [Bythopirellula polymerisocia]